MKRTTGTLSVARAAMVAALMVAVPGCLGDPAEIAKKRAEAAAAKGRADATKAIAAGQLALKQYPPLPDPPGHAEYVKLLQQRCGVVWVTAKLPAGVRPEDFQEEVRSWNEVMEQEIRKQFGAKILAELKAEAQKRRPSPSNAAEDSGSGGAAAPGH